MMKNEIDLVHFSKFDLDLMESRAQSPLPGWNLFQKEAMSGKQLEPEMWKEHQRECSFRWKQLSAEERAKYEMQAAEEQALREAAASEPFQAKKPGPNQAEHGGAASYLCRNAKKTVARQRLMASYMHFRSASEWSEFDTGVFSAEGAVGLDIIDLETDMSEIAKQWECFAEPASDIPADWKGNHAASASEEIHHSICHQNHGGLCKSTPHLDLVTQFVHSLADFVNSGHLDWKSCVNWQSVCTNHRYHVT